MANLRDAQRKSEKLQVDKRRKRDNREKGKWHAKEYPMLATGGEGVVEGRYHSEAIAF